MRRKQENRRDDFPYLENVKTITSRNTTDSAEDLLIFVYVVAMLKYSMLKESWLIG